MEAPVSNSGKIFDIFHAPFLSHSDCSIRVSTLLLTVVWILLCNSVVITPKALLQWLAYLYTKFQVIPISGLVRSQV